MTTYQISWYIKRIPNGPGRRALVGTERFNVFANAATQAEALLNAGHEVRILPLEVKP
jgi:hypothetical protein